MSDAVDALEAHVRTATEPDPDGTQNDQSALWIGQQQLKQAASEGDIPCERAEVAPLVEALAESGRVVTWHGLTAPPDDAHLRAIIESERMCDFPRTLLIGKLNRTLSERGDGDE